MPEDDDSFVGRGIAFPVRLSDQSRLAMVSNDANIRRSIRLILFTAPGERLMRPDFGCEIHLLIFAPANNETAILAERYVTEALTRWEPRIELVSVQIDFGQIELGEMFINIVYKIKNQADERSLVMPYYLIP
jgi:uncharacterized protein